MYQLTRRQLLAAAAAGAGVTALGLAGCSTDDSKETTKGPDLSANREGAMDKYGVGDQFKATAPLSLSVMVLSNAAYPYKADWPFWSELTKRTNVTLQPTVIPGSDYNQKRSVMISAGDAPLLIPKTYHPDEEGYIASGAILPVSDYIDLMPNFKDQISKWNLQSDLDGLREQDGKFYLLPGLHEDVWLDYSLAVRTDVLSQLSLPAPKTWDDVHTMLTAMKAAHPDIYPFSDRWSTPPGPGGNNLLNMVAQAYGTQAGWGYQPTTWDTNASQFVLTGSMDQYKQTLQYLNGLVSEKLLDPETFTQKDDAPAEVRHRQVTGHQLQRDDPEQREPGRHQGHTGGHGRQDPDPDRTPRQREDRHSARGRHDDLGEGPGQQELRRPAAVRRLAVLLPGRQDVRQVGNPGHHLHG